jgi:Tol biopolymer transport system component
MPTDWSPDGRFLTFSELSGAGSYKQLALPLDGGPPHSLGDSVESSATYSPDGARLAYVSSQTGQLETWVRPVSGSGRAIRLSAAGGIDPAWVSNESVSFLDLAGRLMIARLPPDGAPVPPPTVRVATRVTSPENARNNYAWTPDGARVLVNEPARDNDARIHVMANWSTRGH